MSFVDAHMHLWGGGPIRYPWLSPPFEDAGPNGSVEAIAGDYRPADYRADTRRWNMVGAVHVEAGADPAQALEETAWLDAVAEADGLPCAIVAHAPLDHPRLDETLAGHAAFARVRGIRHIVNWHPDRDRSYTSVDLTRDQRWRDGFARLARFGFSFDLQCYPAQMPSLATLMAAHPDVPVIVNHLGMPVLTDADGIDDWRRGMSALAALPHVAVKLSGLGFIHRQWTEEGVRPFLVETLDLFGPHRCLFATDAPTDTLFAPLHRSLALYRDVASTCSPDEQRDMWGRNAARLYRLDVPL